MDRGADSEILEALVECSRNLLAYLDRDFRFVRVNRAYAEAAGRPAAELAGRNHFELYPHAENQAIFEHARDTGVPAVWREKPFEYPDQPERGVTYWDWTLTPVRSAGGEVEGLVLSLNEVTGSVRAREALVRSEQQYRTLFESMNEGHALHEMIFDREGRPVDYRFLDVNPAFARLTGLEPADVIGRTVREVLPEIEPSWIERYGRVVSSGESTRFESYSGALRRWYEVYAYRPAPGRFAVSFADISERKRIEEERTNAEIRLRQASRRKDEFLGMLSHELRNPLAPITNSLFILELTEPTSPQALRARSVIRRQLEHLTRLVDDLLDVTRIARGKIELRCEQVDLALLVRGAAEDHRALLADRGLTLLLEIPSEKVWIDGDATRISQVVGNLLQNAAKYTPAGGAVTVGLRRCSPCAELVVRDTGLGIEPDLLAQVFEPFVQGERTLARTEGGLGLGLAVVKGIAELHGGRVRAESGGRGSGTAITVELPLGEGDGAGRELPEWP